MDESRLAEIKAAWIGPNNDGLAIVGNATYKMVAELIEEVEARLLADVYIPFECSKVRYGHESTALKAVEAMTRKGSQGLEAYLCDGCSGWHIGHPTSNVIDVLVRDYDLNGRTRQMLKSEHHNQG